MEQQRAPWIASICMASIAVTVERMRPIMDAEFTLRSKRRILHTTYIPNQMLTASSECTTAQF
ncbi:hypothetical protein DPMN_146844 [Dreissena polymorpha]|uniref:Uncharacterized protein n=1 Tax=Dreissena polymorpha TaxID=45954 RepID=A0A9D4F8Q3_DREPO|nr:hypothetical protein DPMN_146844 [Dreissena polymorpha]